MHPWLLNFWRYIRDLQRMELFTAIEAQDIATIKVQYELDPKRYQ
jgi:hypothetical protein